MVVVEALSLAPSLAKVVCIEFLFFRTVRCDWLTRVYLGWMGARRRELLLFRSFVTISQQHHQQPLRDKPIESGARSIYEQGEER
ncbi:MAG: hypothetical protein BYD32DRAFT_410881 [Podila humilis]|nr:MAG: hypothetical protein BYD32DRAFT_410881 [Podila humilis]